MDVLYLSKDEEQFINLFREATPKAKAILYAKLIKDEMKVMEQANKRIKHWQNQMEKHLAEVTI